MKNEFEKKIYIIVGILIALTIAFPPYQLMVHGIVRLSGYKFISSLNQWEMINFPALLMEWLAIIIFAFIIIKVKSK